VGEEYQRQNNLGEGGVKIGWDAKEGRSAVRSKNLEKVLLEKKHRRKAKET